MDCSLLTTPITDIETDCIAVGLFADGTLSESALALDDASGGALSNLVERGYASGKLGRTTLAFDPAGCKTRRVVLIGCGSQDEFRDKAYRKVISTAANLMRDDAICHGVLSLADLPVVERDSDWRLEQMVVVAHAALYRFDELKNVNDEDVETELSLVCNGNNEAVFQRAIAIARGVALTRTLGNRPGNVCTPSHLAQQAEDLAKHCRLLNVSVLEQADMEELGMGALLSVSAGSRQAPKLIVLEYRNADQNQAPIGLVGKGVTFDSGGISIKPAALMDEMKYDMSGGGSVLGLFCALTALQPEVNVVGVIPAVENLPDGIATKPGDVVKSLSGKTIEVLNTDAEGRLILCDSLTYIQKFEPSVIIDIATLTGACMIALGNHATGLFSNDTELQAELTACGERTGDRVWPMPTWDDYDEQLKSQVADVANIGGRAGGAITAACFLQRFVNGQRWAHLDIAGTAWKSGGHKDATGRPVQLLVDYVLSKTSASS